MSACFRSVGSHLFHSFPCFPPRFFSPNALFGTTSSSLHDPPPKWPVQLEVRIFFEAKDFLRLFKFMCRNRKCIALFGGWFDAEGGDHLTIHCYCPFPLLFLNSYIPFFAKHTGWHRCLGGARGAEGGQPGFFFGVYFTVSPRKFTVVAAVNSQHGSLLRVLNFLFQKI